jgi:hypothetical protein
MTTPHPDKALIDAITSGAPAELRIFVERPWLPATSVDQALGHGVQFGWSNVRLKPADTHREKTVRYPVPMQVMPEVHTEYWMVHVDEPFLQPWLNDAEDMRYFKAGLCYESHREAEAREAWEARFGEGWK